MGMFNWVKFKMKCPHCGKSVANFQTKDGDSSMTEVDWWTVSNFYTSCECGLWIEFHRKHKEIPDEDIEKYFTMTTEMDTEE